MIPKRDLEKILEASVQAPSGSNSQPWRFVLDMDVLSIMALPDKDHPILNFKNRGTLVAHGALIENLCIASRNLGYEPKIELFPYDKNPNFIANVTFDNTIKKDDLTTDIIFKRSTNRKLYEDYSLSTDLKNHLLKNVPNTVEVLVLDDKAKMRVVGTALSVNEVIMLENRQLHSLFFDEIVWSKEEEDLKKSGLYIKTMELKPPQEAVLRLLKRWGLMKIFNLFHFSKLIAADNAKIYSSGSAMIAIVCKDVDRDFLECGRAMQRIWLNAIRCGLEAQIISGIPFLWQRIFLGDDSFSFSENEKLTINDSYEKLLNSFDVKNGIISLVLRVGKADQPSARSSKSVVAI
jgi:hypothetical protein